MPGTSRSREHHLLLHSLTVAFTLATLAALPTSSQAAPLFWPARIDMAASGRGSYDASAADLNGDEHLDLVFLDDVLGHLCVMLGRGDGSFAPAIEYDTAGWSRGLALADMDGDLRLDAVVTSNYGDIMVFRGQKSERGASRAHLLRIDASGTALARGVRYQRAAGLVDPACGHGFRRHRGGVGWTRLARP